MRLRAIVLFSAVLTLLFTSFAFAKDDKGESTRTRGPVRLAKTSDFDGPLESVLNINALTTFADTKGFFDAVIESSWNGEFPKGSGVGVIFREGIVWAAKVKDDNPLIIRAGGSSQTNGLQGGGAVGYVADPYSPPTGFEDEATTQVWRVRTDWETADLTSDAASFNIIGVADVSGGDTDALRDQYSHDWDHWPADDGAPFEDLDGDGTYNPAVDIPGFPGASQTMWFVSNDLDDDVSAVLAGSPSIGLEMQMTLFAFDFPSTNPLGNMSFKRVRLIYTGRVGGPSDARIDTMYVTQWSDPDLGDFGDDFVGSDTLLSLGFVYNGNKKDAEYFGRFGSPVPAAGYDFLQGPINADGDTLGMSSFTFFGAGSGVSDPDRGVYSGTLQWFNLMEGFLPRPEYPEQVRLLDPITDEATNFWLAGDPVTQSGWVDGLFLPPGDRRMLVTTGPFEMALGDTQDIVIAFVGGIGLDNITSVTVMKFVDTFAQFAFDNDFIIPSPPTPVAEAVELDGRIILNWGSDLADIASVEDAVSLGFVFEGYNVYQLPSTASSLSDGKRLATFDLSNGVLVIEDDGIDPSSGLIRPQAKQFGTDSGIQRFFSTDRDEIRGRPMSNGITYFFALTAYTFLPEELQATSPFKTLESSPVIFALTPQEPVPGTAYDVTNDEFGEAIEVTHIGTADASMTVNVVDPTKITGDDYQVFFNKQLFFLDASGVWQFANPDSSLPKTAGKIADVSGSTISPAAIFSESIGTVDLLFMVDIVSPDFNFADGVRLTFPSEIVINSASSEDGIVSIIDVDSNAVMFGDNDTTGDGAFSGGQLVVVNVNIFTPPLDVDYIIYDDGFAALFCVVPENVALCESLGIGPGFTEIVNATGTATVSEIGLGFKTEEHWNLLDVTTGEIVLEDQTVLVGVDIFTGEIFGLPAAPIVQESFQLHIDGSYSAPLTIFSTAFTVDADDSDGDLSIWGDGTLFGNPDGFWTTFGSGTPVPTIDQAQADLEFRFTGVAPDNDSPVTEGGSFSTQWEKDAFGEPDLTGFNRVQLRIPFEVWNVDGSDSSLHHQIEVAVINRNADDESPYGNDVGTEATARWRMSGRDYMVILNKPYTDDARLWNVP